MPLEQFRIEHAGARQVQRGLKRQFRIQPAVRVLQADGHWPPVMDVDHAAQAVGRDQHEARFFAVELEWTEMRQRQQEERTLVLAVDMPGLFRPLFAGPFIPAIGADDAAPLAQQRLPVRAGQLVQARIDGDRDFLLAGRGYGGCGPGRAVAPEHIVDAAHAVFDMHHRTIGTRRHVLVRLGLAVEYRVGPAEGRRQYPRRVILIESSTHGEIIPDACAIARTVRAARGYLDGNHANVGDRTDHNAAMRHTGSKSGG